MWLIYLFIYLGQERFTGHLGEIRFDSEDSVSEGIVRFEIISSSLGHVDFESKYRFCMHTNTDTEENCVMTPGLKSLTNIFCKVVILVCDFQHSVSAPSRSMSSHLH